MTKKFQWSRSLLSYLADGDELPREVVKAGAEVIAANSRFAIQDATLKLQQGVITLEEWTAIMRAALTNQEIAIEALARGGFDQVRPADYARASARIVTHFEYVRGFQERIVSGYYGPTLERNGILNHAAMYAGTARASYENVSIAVNREVGRTEARRIRGASDHCPDCVAWGNLGWITIELMESKYAIGMSECGPGRCNCVIIFR